MIPLRIRAEGAQGEAPFIVRLSGPEAEREVAGPWDARLQDGDDAGSAYRSRHGILRLSGASAAELAGDVLLVDPVRKTGHRLIRSGSHHNTFLVTERCDQLCVMCSQPPKEHHTDLFPLFQEAALLAPRGMTIGISGGEPTLFKAELFKLLQRTLTARPDLEFHILTNGQHFDENDAGFLKTLPPGKVLWGIPLYASDPGLHDEIVGKAGAFARLTDSFALLARSGATVELRTVLNKTNAADLEGLGTYIAAQLPFIAVWAIMQLENIGFGRMNWDRLFYDNGVAFAPVGAAIDTASGRGLKVALYNFPLCTVPEPYRRYAAPSISDWKRRYLEPCGECRLRQGCGGFFEWYPEKRGFATVGPV